MFIDYLRIAKLAELKPQNRLQRRDMFMTVIIPKVEFLTASRGYEVSANMTGIELCLSQPARGRFHSAAT
jgi:hypothetical protein